MNSREKNPNTRLLVGYEGDFTNASAAAILFLWQNWHAYFKLHDTLIECQPTSSYSWAANTFFGSGEWYLTQQDCKITSGLLHFHNYISFLGTLSKVQTILQYHELGDGRIWYCGGGYGFLPIFLNPISRIPQLIASYLLSRIGRIGGTIAQKITSMPEFVKEKCGFEAAVIFD